MRRSVHTANGAFCLPPPPADAHTDSTWRAWGKEWTRYAADVAHTAVDVVRTIVRLLADAGRAIVANRTLFPFIVLVVVCHLTNVTTLALAAIEKVDLVKILHEFRVGWSPVAQEEARAWREVVTFGTRTLMPALMQAWGLTKAAGEAAGAVAGTTIGGGVLALTLASGE